LERLRAADPRRWLLAFDFDGTLSEIVPRPGDAVFDPALAPLLERLAGIVGYLAVVSGRDRATLSARVPQGWLVLGSYGLELPESISAAGYPDGFDPVAARDSLEAVAHDLAALVARWPGARLERKTWGIAVHFRGGAEDAYADPATFAEIQGLAQGHGCRAVAGRLVIEVEPPGAVDKGWAVRHLAGRLSPSAVVFTGDDLGDVAAWRAVKELGSTKPAVAVGIRSAEMPPSELEVCDVVLEGRDHLADLLGALWEIAQA
jgi:trehalose 6-phosphate phosphatase